MRGVVAAVPKLMKMLDAPNRMYVKQRGPLSVC
jgi:hypothetical protein